jgi:hypothetical protein
MNDQPEPEALIGRNHALLRRAWATCAYTLLLFDEGGEAILAANAAKMRARLLLRRRPVAIPLSRRTT